MPNYTLDLVRLITLALYIPIYGCTSDSDSVVLLDPSFDLSVNERLNSSSPINQGANLMDALDVSIVGHVNLQDAGTQEINEQEISPQDLGIKMDLALEDQEITSIDFSRVDDVDQTLTPPSPLPTWIPLDLSQVDAYAIPRSAKIFADLHPDYARIPNLISIATSNVQVRVSVHIYLIDSEIWTHSDLLIPYLELVTAYFNQARIQLDFTFQHGQAPNWTEDVNQLHLYFARAMRNPTNRIPDGFGNLPAGKAVLNDRLMDRPHVHMNPLFLPGKPLGHEIGHVLGLPHVNARRFLMAQGTSAQNQLDLSPEEAVIMRVMALYRFGGERIDE